MSKKRRNPWTREQLDFLIRNYADTSTELMSVMFDRPRQHIVVKASELGLRKSPEFLSRLRESVGGIRWWNRAKS